MNRTIMELFCHSIAKFDRKLCTFCFKVHIKLNLDRSNSH